MGISDSLRLIRNFSLSNGHLYLYVVSCWACRFIMHCPYLLLSFGSPLLRWVDALSRNFRDKTDIYHFVFIYNQILFLQMCPELFEKYFNQAFYGKSFPKAPQRIYIRHFVSTFKSKELLKAKSIENLVFDLFASKTIISILNKNLEHHNKVKRLGSCIRIFHVWGPLFLSFL